MTTPLDALLGRLAVAGEELELRGLINFGDGLMAETLADASGRPIGWTIKSSTDGASDWSTDWDGEGNPLATINTSNEDLSLGDAGSIPFAGWYLSGTNRLNAKIDIVFDGAGIDVGTGSILVPIPSVLGGDTRPIIGDFHPFVVQTMVFDDSTGKWTTNTGLAVFSGPNFLAVSIDALQIPAMDTNDKLVIICHDIPIEAYVPA